jgi:hypothetical protein
MRARTGRDVLSTWLIAGLIFFSTVSIVRSMGRSPETRMQALVVGYVGLAAVGIALFRTGNWVIRTGPSSIPARTALYVLIAVAGALWLLALVFPFL